MGIAGLLPLLKSIQVNKHLSEFAGKTLAVDAYVWLHRGIFTCATELATGKNTHKYVDYAMHRVRLLRHHGIEPYLVFDGGPLPAKRGTEGERKQRREKNLARANALASQGKHSQAREFYVKCVDVTPQMAYQLIKALKAESVSYVVAPYEADAQLAYLERIGLVDGIITEDSDLLVFGCRTVLFKLDDVSCTISCVSRSDFSSVSDPTTGVSLVGWSDTQFRAMAILSGCDYLPSIPGIGLKTAWSMLKKYRTAEKVVQIVRLEGKKSVPTEYMKRYRLAEQCFLHQRVYDPLECRLVHLTDVGENWDAEADAYVGEDIEPSLAKMIAEGDADPVTRQPMEDINPGYTPRVLKQVDLNRKGKSKAKPTTGKPASKPSPKPGGILDFFGSKAVIPSSAKATKATSLRPTQHGSTRKMVVGQASGKRTLVELMDQDLATKRARREQSQSRKNVTNKDCDLSLSKFFSSQAGPSRVKLEEFEAKKENVCIVIDDDSDCEEITSNCDVSVLAKGHVDADMLIEVASGIVDDVVQQEDGYISPSPSYSYSQDSPDLSSPPRAVSQSKRPCSPSREFGVEPISSPPSQSPSASRRKKARRRSWSCTPNVETPTRSRLWTQSPEAVCLGPDLRDTFCDEISSEIGGFDEDDCYGEADISGSTSPPSPSPPTPLDNTRIIMDIQINDNDALDTDLSNLYDPFGGEVDPKAHRERLEAVALGWKERWTFAANRGLRRSDTTITASGRHTPLMERGGGVRKGSVFRQIASAKPIPMMRQRKSLTFVRQGEE